MKLYGKKALALVMAMALTLSLCSMSAFAAGRIEITKVEFDYEELVVPYGTDEDIVASLLPEDATVSFDEGDDEIWDIGGRYELEDWDVEFDDDDEVYICKTWPVDDEDYTWDDDEIEDKDCTLIVKTTDEYTGDDAIDLTYKVAYYDNDEVELDLDELIADLLMIKFEKYEIEVDPSDVDVDDYDEDDLTYGEVNDLVYSVDLSNDDYDKLVEDGELDEAVIAYEVDGDIEFEGELTITLYNSVKEFTYKMEDELSFNFGEWIADLLDKAMTEDLEYVEFTLDSRNKCGTLYADDDLTEFDEDVEYYYKSKDSSDPDIEDLYFVSNGIEDEFEIDYEAYGEDDEVLEGTIYIECSEFLFLDVAINSDETYTFDSVDFEDLVEDWGDDDYELLYLDNIKIVTEDGGYLYYDYDEDDKTHDEIDDSEEYYVDDDEDDIIDDITYVPGSKTKGIVLIEFDAKVKKSQSNQPTVPGIIQINVAKKADITVNAGVNSLVQIDDELFQDYLDKDTKSTKYDVAYVTIYNAPKKAAEGYLYSDGAAIKSGSSKTFYAKPTSSQYDLADLYFQAGTTKGTYTATFKVFYYKTSSKAYSTSEGTIDFVVAEPTTMSGEIAASQTLSFGNLETLRAFAALGGNENLYVSFDRLPVGGKLVYDWGAATQQDVKPGTAYYIAGSSTVRQISKITFIPSYSAVKSSDKTITIPVTCYNAKNQAVKGSINITVKYAQYSEQFTDITTSTYADSVDFLYNHGITTGASTYSFEPNGNVKRAEFVTFLWRAAGKPAPSAATIANNKFTDVQATGTYAYAYNAILWAVEKGITTGTSATTFSPASSVTHEQLITFLYRYDVNYLKHYNAGSSAVSYVGWSSMAVDHYAYTPARWAAAKGILTDSTTYPTTAGTRATVALWLHRMLTL